MSSNAVLRKRNFVSPISRGGRRISNSAFLSRLLFGYYVLYNSIEASCHGIWTKEKFSLDFTPFFPIIFAAGFQDFVFVIQLIPIWPLPNFGKQKNRNFCLHALECYVKLILYVIDDSFLLCGRDKKTFVKSICQLPCFRLQQSSAISETVQNISYQNQ